MLAVLLFDRSAIISRILEICVVPTCGLNSAFTDAVNTRSTCRTPVDHVASMPERRATKQDR